MDFVTISYNIQNHGEIAYQPKTLIQLPKDATFHLIPHDCIQENSTFMTCILGSGSALQKNQEYTFEVTIKLNQLEINEIFEVHAIVTSSGDEENQNDNHDSILITLTEFSDVEVIGYAKQLFIHNNHFFINFFFDRKTLPNVISMDATKTKSSNMSFVYEVLNIGPSTITNSILEIYIPANYSGINQIITPKDIIVTSEYEGRLLDSTWQQTEMKYDSLISDLKNGSFEHERSKRSYNRYTRQIIESFPATVTPVQESLGLNIFESMPSNRTIYFNCTHGTHECIKISFTIKDFLKTIGNRLVRVVVNVTLIEERLSKNFSLKMFVEKY